MYSDFAPAISFRQHTFVCSAGRTFSHRLDRPEGRRYVDGFAYVKIEARILARAQCGKVSRLFSSRRTFLRSLSRSALVLSLENILSLARPVWAKSRHWRGLQS